MSEICIGPDGKYQDHQWDFSEESRIRHEEDGIFRCNTCGEKPRGADLNWLTALHRKLYGDSCCIPIAMTEGSVKADEANEAIRRRNS